MTIWWGFVIAAVLFCILIATGVIRVNFEMDVEFYEDCPECDGKGGYEVRECSNYSNECCGGCYKTHKCERCDGTGEILKEEL